MVYGLKGTRTRTNTNPYGTKPMLRVEVGARALRNQAGGEGGWLDTSVRRGLRGARECGSIFARDYSKLRADGPHANELKVGGPFFSPAAIVSRRRR